MSTLKLVEDRDTGVLALIVRGLVTREEVDVILQPILDVKASIRAAGRPVRMLLVANSDAESGFIIAARLTGLRQESDRLALVVGVNAVRDDLGSLVSDVPVQVFQRSTDALRWLLPSAHEAESLATRV